MYAIRSYYAGTGEQILTVGSGRLSGSRPPAPETGPLTKKEVDAALPDYPALMQQIRVRSQFQGGRPAGFVIYKIEPGSIFERMGLENSDVIVKVNGMEITSVITSYSIHYTKLYEVSSGFCYPILKGAW